eukprot:Nk52_evm43s270 gene=Nk52_evmTU43s270
MSDNGKGGKKEVQYGTKELNPENLKPCCVCPETKKPRDACIVEKGEANCQDLIEAHKVCMRSYGFKV